MKRLIFLMLIPLLFLIKIAFADGTILIINSTEDYDSYADSLIVYYQVCSLPTETLIICTNIQHTPEIKNPEAWPLNISSNEKQVIVYQVDVYNGGFKTFTQHFAKYDCYNTDKRGSIILMADNNIQRVACNKF